MSDHYKPLFAKRAQMLEQLVYIYESAEKYQLTHVEILDRINKRIKKNDDIKWDKLPRWLTAYIEGYEDALEGIHKHNNIVWRVCYNGELIDGKDVPQGAWNKVDGDKGAHVYKDTGKIYFQFDKDGNRIV